MNYSGVTSAAWQQQLAAPAAPHAQYCGQNLVPEPPLQAEAGARAGSPRRPDLVRPPRCAPALGPLRRVVVPVLVRDGQPCGGSAEAGTAAARDKSAAPPAAALPCARLRRLRACRFRPLPRLPALSAPCPGLLELVRQPRGAGTWGCRTRSEPQAGPAYSRRPGARPAAPPLSARGSSPRPHRPAPGTKHRLFPDRQTQS